MPVYEGVSMIRILAVTMLVGALLVSSSSRVCAGEADDLQRMIDTARQGAKDLSGLDEQRAARDELTLINVWLDAAWRMRSEQKYDEVREVLDRCQAQAEMIREKITASKAVADANRKEAEVARIRSEIQKTKEALHQATIQKAALEARTK
jgi:hypothetical protein